MLREAFLGRSEVDPGAVSLAVPAVIVTLSVLFGSSIRNSLTVSMAGLVGGSFAGCTSVLLVLIYLLQETADKLGSNNSAGVVFWNVSLSLCTVGAAWSAGIFSKRLVSYIKQNPILAQPV